MMRNITSYRVEAPKQKTRMTTKTHISAACGANVISLPAGRRDNRTCSSEHKSKTYIFLFSDNWQHRNTLLRRFLVIRCRSQVFYN